MKISTFLSKATARIRKCWVNRSPRRGECCTITAIPYGSSWTDASEYLRKAGRIYCLVNWNDHPERKKAEVIALFAKARAAALRDEAKVAKKRKTAK